MNVLWGVARVVTAARKLARWTACNVLRQHDWEYKYRSFSGVRHFDDGSTSFGPEHVGPVCKHCHRMRRNP